MMEQNNNQMAQREITVNSPKGFNVRVDANKERIVILVGCGQKSVRYNKIEAKGDCGESVQITAPRILQVYVDSSESKIKVTVEVHIDLYTEYTREEVLETVRMFEKNHPYLEGEITQIKVQSLRETEMTFWMLTTTGQILADQLSFYKLKDLEMDSKTKLSYIIRRNTEELFNQLSEEERRKKFDNLKDVWMVKIADDKQKEEERLREKMMNS